MPLQTDFILNARIIYTPFKFVNFSTHYQYVGNRSREIEDTRHELTGYHKLNVSLMIHAVKINTKFRMGIDNVLNEDIRIPTSISNLYPVKATYPGDFPAPGRMMWFKIIYEY